VFRYKWWVLTPTQEVKIAESLGLLNGTKQLVWEMAQIRLMMSAADGSNGAGLQNELDANAD
jgi:hypothetical protein